MKRHSVVPNWLFVLPVMFSSLLLNESLLAQQPARAVIAGRQQVAVGSSVVLNANQSIGHTKWLLPQTTDFDIAMYSGGKQLSFSCPTPRTLEFVLATAAVDANGNLTQDLTRFTVVVGRGDMVEPPPDKPPANPPPKDKPASNVTEDELAEIRQTCVQATNAVNDPEAASKLAQAYQSDLFTLSDPDITLDDAKRKLERTRLRVLAVRKNVHSDWYSWRTAVSKVVKAAGVETTNDLILVYEAIVAGLKDSSQPSEPKSEKASNAKPLTVGEAGAPSSLPPAATQLIESFTVPTINLPPNILTVPHSAPVRQAPVRYRRVCDPITGQCHLVPF